MTYRTDTILGRVFSFAFALLFLTSCMKDDGELTFLRSYINTYSEGFSLKSGVGDEGVRLCLYLRENDRNSLYYSPETHDHKTNAQFLQIAERNGDRSYNKKKAFSLYVTIMCSAHNFSNVQIVCLDKAWDDIHPVGVSINDLVEIEYYSYAKFVMSGYRNELQWNGHVKKPLYLLTEGDLTMVETAIHFSLDLPAAPGSYEMQVTMTTTEGEEKVARCTVDF